MKLSITIHIPDHVQEGKQMCRRCGKVLFNLGAHCYNSDVRNAGPVAAGLPVGEVSGHFEGGSLLIGVIGMPIISDTLDDNEVACTRSTA